MVSFNGALYKNLIPFEILHFPITKDNTLKPVINLIFHRISILRLLMLS